jgi:putative hydrolase of HD superfamily
MTGRVLPSGSDQYKSDAQEAVGFLLSVDGLKQVERQTPLVSGQRRERTAEHSWHLAVAVLCLHEYASDQLDLGRALELAIIHDLPELAVGDTFVFGANAESRRAREEPALKAMLSRQAGRAGVEIMEAWREYEYGTSVEGRFVMALDVLLPIFINLAAGRQSSWAKHQVLATDVRKRIDSVRQSTPLLAELADNAIDEAVTMGLLR